MVVSRLKPAAPSVDLSVVWRDTVKRGPMTREVRGLGTLVPEETMLIPATTEGRVQRILIRPGTPVKATPVVMILTSPELETELLRLPSSPRRPPKRTTPTCKVTLEKLNLDMQSTVAQVGADYTTAKLQGDRDQALAKEAVQRGGRQDFGGQGRAAGKPPATGAETAFRSTRRRKRPS